MAVRLLVDTADLIGRVSSGAEALEDALMHLLLIEGRILVDLVIIVVTGDLAYSLGLAESVIEHALIVAEEGHLASEARVPMVLRLREAIVTLLNGGRVRLSSARIVVNLGVLAELIVERALLVSRLVNGTQAARRVRDVSVTTAAVISVHNWLRVDVCKRLSRSLLCHNERTYSVKTLVSHKVRIAFGLIETAKMAVATSTAATYTSMP